MSVNNVNGVGRVVLPTQANQPTDTPKIFSFKIDQDTSVTPNAWTIRLTGNVSGAPPFRGVLKHHGSLLLCIF